MRQMGRRLGIEALRAVAAQPGWPTQLGEAGGFSSSQPLVLFRWESVDAPLPSLSSVGESVDFPLLPLPTLEEISEARERAETEFREAEERGAAESELRFLRYHGLNWARSAETEIRSGKAPTSARGSIHALRIGDGAIVTGPG